MFKILLADDEGLVLESLQRIITNHFGELCKVQTAKTGRAVIELAEEFRPDIAIMDIQMPGINGIEAIEEMIKFCPRTRFIIMSAYDTFDYAKRAMELGVIEFLTKPANTMRIISVIEKAMKLVEEEQQKREKDLAVREKMEAVLPVLENGMIYAILFENNDVSDLNRYRELLDLKEEYGTVIVIEIGDEIENHKMTNVVGTSVKAQKFYYEFSLIVKEFFSAIVGPVMTNRVVVYIPLDEKILQDEYNERVKTIEKTRNMLKKLTTRIELQFRAGIGSIRPFYNSYSSYQEACRALKHVEGSVLHISDYVANQEVDKNYPMETENEMFESLRKGNVQHTITLAKDFFTWMENNYSNCLQDIKLKILELVMYAERIAFQEGGMSYHFRDRSEYMTTVEQTESLDRLREWFIDKMKAATEIIHGKSSEKYSDLVECARQYIEANFSKDISLDDVSREVKISPYYFSKVFKDETGDTFVEYLTRLRMDQAKKLLKNRDNSIKQICVESGYSDPNYFSRIFKKNVGVTPSEYRERNDTLS